MSNLTIILGTVLVVLIIYMLFQSYFDGEQKLLSQALLSNALPVERANISKPNAPNFSYGIWIYVQEWQKPTAISGVSGVTIEQASRIFARQDEIGLYLDENATLKVRVADYASGDVNSGAAKGPLATSGHTYSDIILTQNFPIQKWVHVGLVVDGNKFDGYIDGKMVKSVGLKTNITPDLANGYAKHGIEFGNKNTMNESLMIAEHKRRTYPMDPKGMWDLYMKGNGVSGLTQAAGSMNVNLSVLKDGVESSKIALF
jgi:hypothetical protein